MIIYFNDTDNNTI